MTFRIWVSRYFNQTLFPTLIHSLNDCRPVSWGWGEKIEHTFKHFFGAGGQVGISMQCFQISRWTSGQRIAVAWQKASANSCVCIIADRFSSIDLGAY
jgi:hypothetical protein